VRRFIAAPPQRVFDAWTDARVIPRWFKPGGVPLRHLEIELRVGGRWHMTMGTPGDRELAGWGEFREIDRPRRIVYTWNWTPDPVGRETVVTVDFLERDRGTEIVIRHQGFPAVRARDQHRGGWAACLAAMAILFPDSDTLQ
jgi:glutathione S-transferase